MTPIRKWNNTRTYGVLVLGATHTVPGLHDLTLLDYRKQHYIGLWKERIVAVNLSFSQIRCIPQSVGVFRQVQQCRDGR